MARHRSVVRTATYQVISQFNQLFAEYGNKREAFKEALGLDEEYTCSDEMPFRVVRVLESYEFLARPSASRLFCEEDDCADCRRRERAYKRARAKKRAQKFATTSPTTLKGL